MKRSPMPPRKQPLGRSKGLNGSQPQRKVSKPLARSQPERDWSAAALKKERCGGACLVCGFEWQHHPGRRLELAHTAGRTHDRPKPCAVCRGEGELCVEAQELFCLRDKWCPACAGTGSQHPAVLYVDPDDVVVLCGPATDTGSCHQLFDSHHGSFDLQPYLTVPQQQRVVAALDGIENARRRLSPSAYERSVA